MNISEFCTTLLPNSCYELRTSCDFVICELKVIHVNERTTNDFHFESSSGKETEWTRFLNWQNELRAKFNWMTINSSGGERRKNERVSKRASMRANDHGSRVLRRSINECICTRVPCNFMYLCPSAWVCLRFFVFIFVHFQLTVELLWFHISHHQSKAKEKEMRGKMLSTVNVMMSRSEEEKNWVDQKDWRWWLAMNSNWLGLAWLYHICACVSALVFLPDSWLLH